MTDDPRLAPAIVAACEAVMHSTPCEFPACDEDCGRQRVRMTAALAAADRAAWRTINLAPSNVPLLVFDCASGEVIIAFRDRMICWVGVNGPLPSSYSLSHWMPLPSAPEIPADLASPAKEPASSA